MKKYSAYTASPQWSVYLSILGPVLGWGWGFVAIRDGVHSFSPGELALGRYMIASLTLLIIWFFRGRKLPKWRDLPVITIMGLTGFAFYNLFINSGEQSITAGTAALVSASLPILITLGAFLFFKEPLPLQGWIGVFLSFLGVFITTLGKGTTSSVHIGALLVFCGMLSAAIYGLLTKKMLRTYKALELTTWSVWMGTLGLIPFGRNLPAQLGEASLHAWINLILLGVIPGALCYLLYSFAIAKAPMARVANFLFFIPVTSIILGWLFLGELPCWTAFLGGSITILGALLVHRRGR